MITPNYLELGARDLPATRAFYEAALGFTFTDYGPEYTAVEDGPIEVGFTRSDEVVPPLPTFETDDLDATLEAVVGAGGRIVREPFSYPGGRRFQFLDPSGNEIAIYQPG